MKIEIKPYNITKNPENEITSPSILQKNQRKICEEYKYDPDGLFSKRIFGNVSCCDCGALQEVGYCDECGCRVIDKNNAPDFYIDLKVNLPKLFADFSEFKKYDKRFNHKDVVKDLLTFEIFMYEEDGKLSVCENDGEGQEIDQSKIVFGEEAVKRFVPLDEYEEWAKIWMIDFISVPHPIFRPNLVSEANRIILSPINKVLIDILLELKEIEKFKPIYENSNTRFFLIPYYKRIYKKYDDCMNMIFNLLATSKKSFVASDLRGHRVVSAIKATVVNRYDIDEDIILIGDTFIQTLYPKLYKDCDGDMQAINDYFIKNDERVLTNRPPTICHLSFYGMKPRVASCYKYGTFNDGAKGYNYQSEYDEEIDTIGIRTVAIAPIITDGLASDYDGDSLLIISLFTDNAKQEATTMLPSKNYMNFANGTVRNCIIEDAEYTRNW